jgi:hypothetical protein
VGKYHGIVSYAVGRSGLCFFFMMLTLIVKLWVIVFFGQPENNNAL